MEALFSVGADDCSPSVNAGTIYLGFDREAQTYEEAVLSALTQVLRAANANEEIRVVRVAEDDVSFGEIAKRTSKSRETIRKYANGQRGPGGFPPHTVPGKYQWSAVLAWLEQHQLVDGSAAVSLVQEHGVVLRKLNATLQLQSLGVKPSEVKQLIATLNGT